MNHNGKHYHLEYDETVLDAEVSTAFDDQIIIVLRERNQKSE